MKTYKIKSDFAYKRLEELGYTYSSIEGGYVSKDMATIVIDNRRPYIGQVLQFFTNNERQHLNNIEELTKLDYLEY